MLQNTQQLYYTMTNLPGWSKQEYSNYLLNNDWQSLHILIISHMNYNQSDKRVSICTKRFQAIITGGADCYTSKTRKDADRWTRGAHQLRPEDIIHGCKECPDVPDLKVDQVALDWLLEKRVEKHKLNLMFVYLDHYERRAWNLSHHTLWNQPGY